MRHSNKNRKFTRRGTGRRKSFLRNLKGQLITNGNIETTEARAKETRVGIEKLITIAKRQDLASLRLLLSRLPKEAAFKLYYEIAPRYKDRFGGYAKIVKSIKRRKRDAAKMAIIELIQ